MILSYLVLFTFHPRKIFQVFKRTFLYKKPLTVPDHVMHNIFVRKKIKIVENVNKDLLRAS